MKTGVSRFLLAIVACGLIGGCASQGASDQASNEPESAPAVPNNTTTAPTKPAPAIEAKRATYRAFSQDTLYSLLAAELAGARQQYDITLSNYAQQAEITRDPQIAERATLIARYLNASDIASQTAVLWLELAPQSDEALANAAVSLMQAGRAQEAFAMSQRLQEKGKEPLYQSIAANAGALSAEARATLLASFVAQLAKYPSDEQLLVGTGLLHQISGHPNDALPYAKRAYQHHPKSTAATILYATLLHQLDQPKEALKKLEHALTEQPDNTRMRVQYARILAHTDLVAAQQQFQQLVDRHPQDADLQLSLAVVALEQNDRETAKRSFETLLDLNQHVSSAHFYLGQIAEQEQQNNQAILHYLQVEAGKDFGSATARVLSLMISEGDLTSAAEHVERLIKAAPAQADNLQLLHARILIQYNQLTTAHLILDRAVKNSPDNTSLLFSRAMLYEEIGARARAINDLTTVVELNPQHASALNALGYILLEYPEQWSHAQALLLRAIALRPDDAAILDSVGWLHFKLGNYSESLLFLRRAHKITPDAEISAHLGELLWVIDQREQALEVWGDALEASPNNDVLRQTLKRLEVTLP